MTPPGMRTLVEMTFAVHEDGPNSQIVDNNTKCGEGASFADVYRAILSIKDDIERQIEERRNCPMNPKYGTGLEQFEEKKDQC